MLPVLLCRKTEKQQESEVPFHSNNQNPATGIIDTFLKMQTDISQLCN
jgi:hypothetical protein